jgi:CubicO group peptidase (beta-lactamase class C family)
LALGFDTPVAVVASERVKALVAEQLAGRSSGIVVGLLERDGRRRIIAYGDPGPGQPPLDGNSVFDIGSITKVFTATLLAHLAMHNSGLPRGPTNAGPESGPNPYADYTVAQMYQLVPTAIARSLDFCKLDEWELSC